MPQTPIDQSDFGANWAVPNFSRSGGGVTSIFNSGKTPLPYWMPHPDAITKELESEYGEMPALKAETEGLRQAGIENQGNVLTTAMNAANNAATEYSNRARQSGGSQLGAGLVRAQAQTAGQQSAGDYKVQMQKDVIAARTGAATLASQIANNLGELRMGYLSALASFYQPRGGGGGGGGKKEQKSGSYQTDIFGKVTNLHGNVLEGNPNWNPSTGMLAHAGW